MRTRGAVSLACALALAAVVGGPGARPAAAGQDVCAEPNHELAAACFLGPGASASGFLDTPDDVDSYRLELGRDQMIVATLGSLPGDYILQLRLPDGTVRAEAAQPGVADKVVQADGLAPGPYFLSVSSPRGASSPTQPYLLSLSFEVSLVLSDPTAPGGAVEGSVPYGFIPAPARDYALAAADVGPSFREIFRDEPEAGRVFLQRIVAPDAQPISQGQLWFSLNNIGMVDTRIFLEPYGSNEALAAEVNGILGEWKARGLNVQPTVGWGSEQVYSFAAASEGVMFRGILLKHRNAVVRMDMLGLERHATWDAISRLMRIVEQKIWAAAQ